MSLRGVVCRSSPQCQQGGLRWRLLRPANVDEVERLYRSGLAICHEVRDLPGIGVFLLGLGQMALVQGQHDEAIAMFQEAQQRFLAIGLPNWAAQAEALLAQTQSEGQGLALAELMAMVQAAQNGDQQAGQQVWDISQNLKNADDDSTQKLGRALERLLAGETVEAATAALPEELRAAIVQGLR